MERMRGRGGVYGGGVFLILGRRIERQKNYKIKYVSIYVEIRYLRPHFYSYPLMPSLTGAGVLQVRAPKRFA
jgi:hypothetical protein